MFVQKRPHFHYLQEDNSQEFGRIIKDLTVEAFNLESDRKAAGTLYSFYMSEYYAVHKKFPEGVKERSIREWFNGNFINKHGNLTAERFRWIIKIFWKKGVLNDISDVFDLARAAGNQYVIEAEKDWLRELVGEVTFAQTTPLSSDLRYLQTKVFIERPSLTKQVENAVDFCLEHGEPLVIYGSPGTGKTKFLEMLEKEFSLDDPTSTLTIGFSDGVMSAYLRGGRPDPYLGAWAQALGLIGESNNSNKYTLDVLRGVIQKKLRDDARVILIDDVSKAEYARYLMLGNSSKSLHIITTANPDIANQLTLYANSRINIAGFTDEEAINMYRLLTKTDTFSRKGVKELNYTLSGNPAALHGAFSVIQDPYDNNWWALINDLENKKTELPERLKSSVYAIQNIVYEKVLSPKFQKRFRALGTLESFLAYEKETFAFLWNCSVDEADRTLRELYRFGYPVDSLGDGFWDIHKSVLSVAKDFLEEFPEDARYASQWWQRWQVRLAQNAHGNPDLQIISFVVAVKLLHQKDFEQYLFLFSEDDAKSYFSQKFYPLIFRNLHIFTASEVIKAAMLNTQIKRNEQTVNKLLNAYLLFVAATILSNMFYQIGSRYGTSHPYQLSFVLILSIPAFLFSFIFLGVLLPSSFRYNATLQKLAEKGLWRIVEVELRN